MGDEQEGQAKLQLHVFQQPQGLRLHGHIQGRGWLIGDQHLRTAHQGHGNDDALPLPAGKLVGKLSQPLLGAGHPNLAKQFNGAGPCRNPATRAMPQPNLFQLPAHAVHRIQRRQGILEDHRHAVAAQVRQIALAPAKQSLSLEFQGRGADLRQAWQQTHDGVCGDRLARAGLADQSQGFAGRDGEVDLPHRVQHAAMGRQPYRQAGHPKGRRAHRRLSGPIKSRSESPNRLIATTRRKIAEPGKAMRCGVKRR